MKTALWRLFQAHPDAEGMRYSTHFWLALSIGARLLAAGFACILHAFVPCLFATAASGTVRRLQDEFEERANRESASIIPLVNYRS